MPPTRLWMKGCGSLIIPIWLIVICWSISTPRYIYDGMQVCLYDGMQWWWYTVIYRHNYIGIYIYNDISTLLCTYVLMVIPKNYPHSYLQSKVFYGLFDKEFPLGFLPAKLWRRRQIPRTGLSHYWAKSFPEAVHKSQIWAFRKTFYPIPWLTVLMHHHPFMHVKRLRGTRLYRCI